MDVSVVISPVINQYFCVILLPVNNIIKCALGVFSPSPANEGMYGENVGKIKAVLDN